MAVFSWLFSAHFVLGLGEIFGIPIRAIVFNCGVKLADLLGRSMQF